jgi:hypothetical protein
MLLTLFVVRVSPTCSFVAIAMRAQIGNMRELIGQQRKELPMSQGYLDPLIVECTLGTRS